MQPKDYDSTLARMAGNIAAGFIARGDYDGATDALALAAVNQAERILAVCRGRKAAADRVAASSEGQA